MKKNKFLIIFILILVTGLILYFNYKKIKQYYLYRITDFSQGTGVVYSTPNPQLIIEGNAINNLQRSLPLSTPSFSITKYDYSKGKFLVVPYNGTLNMKADFDTWYSASTFSAVPKSMFLIY